MSKKEDMLKYIKKSCDIIKVNLIHTRLPSDNKKEINNKLDEFYSYFENAVVSSDPFAENVRNMRANGIWLPDKINDSSVKQNYFNVAKGYFFQVLNDANLQKVIYTEQSVHTKTINNTLRNINKVLNDIIDGKVILE